VLPIGKKTCFLEKDPTLALYRRTTSEIVGTLLLVFCVVSAGLTIQQVTESHSAMIVVIALASGGSLCGLIVAFGDSSGGHFNPLITTLQWVSGDRDLRCTVAYIAGQFAGGMAGALLANYLFSSNRPLAYPAINAMHLAVTETTTTAGLMIVIFGCMRGQRTMTGPFAVATWLTANLVASPLAYMNPAITLAATIADGPVALRLSRALVYVAAELIGAAIALAVINVAYPRSKRSEVNS
jgi:glycerol uptake facilitator-like aquaporin